MWIRPALHPSRTLSALLLDSLAIMRAWWIRVPILAWCGFRLVLSLTSVNSLSFMKAIIRKSKLLGYNSCKIQNFGYYTLPYITGAVASSTPGLEMTFIGTAQLSAKQPDLTGLRFGCACSFDCHSNDMDLTQTNSHFRPTNILERKVMR